MGSEMCIRDRDHSADGILALMLESAEVQPGTDSEYNYEFKLLPIGWIS